MGACTQARAATGGPAAAEPAVQPLATIGLMSELFGLTPRAIRHYEERGLIHPARDEANRRLFTAQDRLRLRVIALLRRADVGIEDIARLLAQAGADDLKPLAMRMLRTRKAWLDGQLLEINDLIAEVEAMPRL